MTFEDLLSGRDLLEVLEVSVGGGGLRQLTAATTIAAEINVGSKRLEYSLAVPCRVVYFQRFINSDGVDGG
jgi:hypothetical protein